VLLLPEPGLVGVHRLVRPDEARRRHVLKGLPSAIALDDVLSGSALAGEGQEGFVAGGRS
jgi:hypothetical protein